MKRFFLLALFGTALLMAGCDVLNIEDRPDPNGPSLDGVLETATRDEVANLVTGVESGLRFEMDIYLADVGIVGREYWRFLIADPRYTGDLLGKENAVLDNNTFYTLRPWRARYRVIRNAHILMQVAEKSKALSEAEKRGVDGFAKTMIAYQLLLNLNLTHNNGVRRDTIDLVTPGHLMGREEALAYIARLLDEAASELDQAGDAFSFPLSEGFQGFDTPAGFRRFNRALAARVSLYREDYNGALQALQASFLDPEGDLQTGVYHVFSSKSGDMLNPIYQDPLGVTSGNAWVVHPSFVAEAESGDHRVVQKVFTREEPLTLDNLSSPHVLYLFKSPVDPIPLIRNEELLLIRAEARIHTGDLNGAVADLNRIRQAAGLSDYAGPVTKAALIDEMLQQRRYSLFGEGHRWIDMRRYGRLDELPIDRPGDNVWEQFPIPASENL